MIWSNPNNCVPPPLGEDVRQVAGACCLSWEHKALTFVLKAGVAYISQDMGGDWWLSKTGDNRVTEVHLSHTDHCWWCALLSHGTSRSAKMGIALLSISLEQWPCHPARTPAQVSHLFALHRVRRLKRTVSTITTFVRWLETCLQLVLRPPPLLSGGQFCTCFSTQKYRVSQKTGRGMTSFLQLPFFCEETEHLSVVWGFCSQEHLWWLLL